MNLWGSDLEPRWPTLKIWIIWMDRMCTSVKNVCGLETKPPMLQRYMSPGSEDIYSMGRAWWVVVTLESRHKWFRFSTLSFRTTFRLMMLKFDWVLKYPLSSNWGRSCYASSLELVERSWLRYMRGRRWEALYLRGSTRRTVHRGWISKESIEGHHTLKMWPQPTRWSLL